MDGNFYGDVELQRAGWCFSVGLLPAESKDGRTGYVDRNGEFAFLVPIINEGNEDLCATNFNNGYALIQTTIDPPIWRVINNKGEFLSDELNFLSAKEFSDGLSLIKTMDNCYGYICPNGDFAIDPVFNEADSFFQGYARIKYQGRDGIINTAGKIFWSDDLAK